MKTKWVATCRAELEHAYEAHLGRRLGTQLQTLGATRDPVWVVVSSIDLTTRADQDAANAAGCLLDPEIGIMLYLLPYGKEADVRRAVLRALELRSSLRAERLAGGEPGERIDARGAWRISLQWLVEEGEEARWKAQMTDLRRETAFSEELSFDATVVRGGNVASALTEHGWPRLLLRSRHVLQLAEKDQALQWLSADALVQAALVRFSDGFSVRGERRLAERIVEAARSFSACVRIGESHDGLKKEPESLASLEVLNFRNLRDIALSFGNGEVAATIVHGPNGSGKSAICEALSIALCGSSWRYSRFCDQETERDVTPRDRHAEYVNRYLQRIADDPREPAIGLNGRKAVPVRGAVTREPAAIQSGVQGTVLAQEASLEFGQLDSSSLGLLVLSGYSPLADHIDDLTEKWVAEANGRRQGFLRELGLPTSIAKIETAYERIVRQAIQSELPALPDRFVVWLEKLSECNADVGGPLAERWRRWGSVEAREELERRLTKVLARPGQAALVMQEWLEAFNELLTTSTEVVTAAQAHAQLLDGGAGGARERLAAWGEWVERPRSSSEPLKDPAGDALRSRLTALQEEEKGVLASGLEMRGRAEHLAGVASFVKQQWSLTHPSECPTCGADHSERGGIVAALDEVQVLTEKKRAELRRNYQRIKKELQEVRDGLTAHGMEECPVSAAQQESFAAALGWLLPGKEGIATYVATRGQRETLGRFIDLVASPPLLPERVWPEPDALRVAEVILKKCEVANESFEDPDNWKVVRGALTRMLTKIVGDHLPNTLGALWEELTLNLTPGSWLLPEHPRVEVEQRRGAKRASLRVQGRLARYVLNQSEMHVLGLAWFLTQYLTRGRFRQCCIVMDDPAHELDDTTFRDLCRLWETWLRLHRVYGRRLKLIVTLNQEGRALDAARATDAMLVILGWTRDQREPTKVVEVRGRGFGSPEPTRLFSTQ